MIFKKHPLLFILVPLCLFAITASFIRFMMVSAYVVEYQGECNPETQKCFAACDDEMCAETHYYVWVKKIASVVRSQCGPDITDCAEASKCAPGEEECSITYCSSEALREGEECEDIDAPLSVPDEISTENTRPVENETAPKTPL